MAIFDQFPFLKRPPLSWRVKLPLSWRFALREMRGGLKGFYIFISCIALGVAAIGGVNGVSKNLNQELMRQGQILLAGDLRINITQRQATLDERTYLASLGVMASNIKMRSMARNLGQQDQTMVEIKAVDEQYPLYGRLKTKPELNNMQRFGARTATAQDQILQPSLQNTMPQSPTIQDTIYGAVVAQALLDRLQLKLGDFIQIGRQNFIITALLEDEPDLLSEGFQLGPRILMSLDALKATGLLQPGSLYSSNYKLKLSNTNDTQITALKNSIDKKFENASWSVQTRMNAAPGLTKNIERFSQFLTLIGLTSLIVGGVGISNAVRNYMDEKRNQIATFKSLGAKGALVTKIYFIQIMLISCIGVSIGLIFAILIPFIVGWFMQSYLPILGQVTIDPMALVIALIFAYLTIIAFTILPLSRARNVSVTTLFRDFNGAVNQRPKITAIGLVAVLLIAIAGLAMITAYDKRMALIFFIAVLGAFIVLRLVAFAIQYVARKMSHSRSVALRLAIGNIYRPGALTASVVMALGLGLTLLVALTTIDGNLRNQLSNSVSQKAPDFFFMDIARNEADRFSALIKQQDPKGVLKIMPTLRARITKLNNIDVKDVKIHPDSAWVLRGDRNVTYASIMPEGTQITQGQWWNHTSDLAPYNGPQVSISEREAQELGLKLGQTISVNVLGHEITAKITSFRKVDWDSFNMNFVMIFSPNTFKNAPHIWLATFKTSNNHDDAQFMRNIAKQHPTITVITVRQVLKDAQTIVAQIGSAIQASAAIAILASVLVLAGALSASNRARAYDAVILKTLGATRRILICAFIYEYAILGLATAVFAIFTGGLSGVAIARYKMGLENAQFLIGTSISVLMIALILSVGLGLIGTWRVLCQKPAKYLKNL